jgi:hypothetical protein
MGASNEVARNVAVAGQKERWVNTMKALAPPHPGHPEVTVRLIRDSAVSNPEAEAIQHLDPGVASSVEP